MTPGVWDRATAIVRRIPASHRGESIPAARARAVLRCRADDVDELVRCGWSTGTDGAGAPLFDGDEILSLGLHSGGGRSLPELGSHLVAEMSRAGVAELTRPRRWTVVVTGTVRPCPACAAEGGVARIADVTAVQGWTGWQPDPAAPVAHPRWRGTATIRGGVEVLRNAAARAAHDTVVSGFSYQFLPAAAQRDPALLERLRVVDCVGAAHLLVAWLAPQGLSVRVRYGLLMYPMGSGTHAWVEIVDDDGRRKRLDPTLVMMTPPPAGSVLPDLVGGSTLNTILPLADDTGTVVRRACCGSPAGMAMAAHPTP